MSALNLTKHQAYALLKILETYDGDADIARVEDHLLVSLKDRIYEFVSGLSDAPLIEDCDIEERLRLADWPEVIDAAHLARAKALRQELELQVALAILMKQRGATTEAQIEDLADANPIFEQIRNKFRGLSNAELILLVVGDPKN